MRMNHAIKALKFPILVATPSKGSPIGIALAGDLGESRAVPKTLGYTEHI